MKNGILVLSVALLPWAALPDMQGKQSAQGKQSKPALPAPPTGQDKPLPPVLDTARSAVERRDLLQQFKRRHPIEGFYRLSAMVGPDGSQVKGSRGYMFIGRRHMTLELFAPSATPGQVNIQSAVRTFRIVGKQLITSSVLGHRNMPNGDIALTKSGQIVEHRYELVGASLRLYRSAREYLEFRRVE